ncbi:MAG: M16 family metallopeptidase [Gammaproteobacteria bacterium]
MKPVHVLLSALLALSSSSQAFQAGGAATEGPVTALQRLDSVSRLSAEPVSRRSFAIESWQTRNGTKVLFVQAQELPLLDVRLVFDAGAARDGELGGLASTVSRMLDEGTPTRDTTAIAAAFEQVGASYSASSYRDMAVAELRVLSDPAFREPALEVFREVVAQPAFPEEPFRRIQQGSEVGQQQQEQSPAALASRLFYQHAYGTHPYAQPPSGTRASLARLGRDDLVRFHQRYYVARNLTMALVGDIPRSEAEAVAEQLSAALPAGEPAPALPEVARLRAARHLHHEFPSQQTHILLGAPGIKRGDADHYALQVGNEILGGGAFTSLLMREIRQKRGLTYGVYSGFTPMRAEGPFLISLSTRADQSQEALRLTRQILGNFVKQGPDEAAVNEAKASIIQGFPMSASSNASIVGYLGAIGFYDLPLDYLDQYLARISAVTADDVRKAFRHHVRPDRLLAVTVGKKAAP